MADNCSGVYLLAMFGGTTGITGMNGTSGANGMKGGCVVDGVVERIPCEVDEELGDCGPVV